MFIDAPGKIRPGSIAKKREENQIVDSPKPPESRVSADFAAHGLKLNRTLLKINNEIKAWKSDNSMYADIFVNMDINCHVKTVYESHSINSNYHLSINGTTGKINKVEETPVRKSTTDDIESLGMIIQKETS